MTSAARGTELAREALRDVREGRLFSTYDADVVLDYFDGIVSLVSVFLYEELGWEPLLNIKNDPRPVLLSVLCFFHVMVFWINIHHFLKYTTVLSLVQVWLLLFVSLGLVLYLLSLDAWIAVSDASFYYVFNAAICLLMSAFNLLMTIDDDVADLFWLWHRFAPSVATVWYVVASGLHFAGVGGSRYMLFVAPFVFTVPLGGKRRGGVRKKRGGMKDILRGAWRDVSERNIISPFGMSRVLAYFDAIVGLATVFLLIEILGYEDSIQAEELTPMLQALLCFFHVMVYWINIHHSFRFSPPTLSVLQVWLIAFMSLALVFYPLSLGAWISDGGNELYYIVNIALCVLVTALLQVTTIDNDAANSLYIIWHNLVGKIAVVWYLVAYLLLRVGKEQLWMLVLGPIAFMFPVGQPASGSSLPRGISALLKSKTDSAYSCDGDDDSLSNERIVVTRYIPCSGVSGVGAELNLMMINCEEGQPYGPARQIALMFLELLSDCARLRCNKAASGKEDGTFRIRITVYHAQRLDYPVTEEEWDRFDGVIIPGSLSAAYDTHIEWIGHLMKVIQSEIVAKSRKTLGICFGHQAFAHSFGMRHGAEEAAQGRAAKCVLGPIAGRRVVPLTSQGRVFVEASCGSTTDNATSEMLYTRGDMVESIPEVAVSLCGSNELPFEAVAYFSSNDDRKKFQTSLDCEEPKPFAVTFQAHPEFVTCTGSNFTYLDCVRSMEDHGQISNQVAKLARLEAGEREKEITRSSLECTYAAANALGWFGGGEVLVS